MKQAYFHGLFLAMAVSLVLFAPVSLAQQSDIGGNNNNEEDNVIGAPTQDDEISDDVVTDGPTLTCAVTKVTTDLDSGRSRAGRGSWSPAWVR